VDVFQEFLLCTLFQHRMVWLFQSSRRRSLAFGHFVQCRNSGRCLYGLESRRPLDQSAFASKSTTPHGCRCTQTRRKIVDIERNDYLCNGTRIVDGRGNRHPRPRPPSHYHATRGCFGNTHPRSTCGPVFGKGHVHYRWSRSFDVLSSGTKVTTRRECAVRFGCSSCGMHACHGSQVVADSGMFVS